MVNSALAIDIGAESGRAVAGWLDAGKLETREVHRFPNGPKEIDGSLRWDYERLVQDCRECLRLAADASTFGVDTWAVDYVLYDDAEQRLGDPYCYRDARTNGVMDSVIARIGKERIYERTGIQFLPFNTLYQLAADKSLSRARHFRMMPDALMHELTGHPGHHCEYTNATSTQFLNAFTKRWDVDLLTQTKLPEHIFPEVVHPGTILELQTAMRPVVVATHDTASAVAGAPLLGENCAWISSGTWSIVGIETPRPIISPATLDANFTNEGGVEGIRFSRNVMGLWILQQCREAWARQGSAASYEEILQQAMAAPSPQSFIDPDDPDFLPPGDMPSRIQEWLEKSGQESPNEPGKVARMIFESLALKYAWVIENIEKLSAKKIDCIHIFGGGSRNTLLNQLTANACGRPVIAGPTEATALGNLAVQFMATGQLPDLKSAREVIGRTLRLETYQPEKSSLQSSYSTFKQLIKRT